MPILSFRASVPLNTPASVPVSIPLNSGARAIQEVVIWSPSTNMAIDKSGYRLLDYGSSKVFIPDVGSNDNGVMAASGESGWAPIPPTTLRLDMHDQLIEGPPYRLTLQLFNKDAAAILVAGFIVVHEPAVRIEPAMLYEILTARNPRAVEAAGEQKTQLQVPHPKKEQKVIRLKER